jgi:hypothetical protein
MLSFSDVVDLFPNELAGLRGGGLPFSCIALRPLQCLRVIVILTCGHGISS